MAEGRIPGANVKIARFAKEELADLLEILSTEAPDLKLEDGAVMSALILAAVRSPPEAVAAVVSTYWEREKEAAAVYAVCAFLRAHAGKH